MGLGFILLDWNLGAPNIPDVYFFPSLSHFCFLICELNKMIPVHRVSRIMRKVAGHMQSAV